MEALIHLIDGCKANNAKHQKVFYEKYLGFVLKTVYRYVSSAESAIEVSNDAFVKIFRSFPKFECTQTVNVEALLMAWIRRIVVNTSIDHIRQTQSLKLNFSVPESIWENKEELTRSDDQLMYKEMIELIRKLSPAYRSVFNMYVIDGYTHQEIAESLGISVGTSKSNLARAKAFLQKHLVKDSKHNQLCLI